MKGLLFVVPILLAGVLPGFAAGQAIGTWSISNEKDLVTEKPFPRATAHSTLGDSFSVLCSPDRGTPMINVGSNRIEFANGEFPAMVWRVDDRPVLAALVKSFAPHDYAIGLGRQTYAALLAASRIRIRAVSANGATIDMDFPLTRTKDALRTVAAACPLESAPDNPPHLYDASQDLFGQLPKPTPKPSTTPSPSPSP